MRVMRLTIVGAGPGAPELLTGMALRRLQEAGVIYYTAERLKKSIPDMQEKAVYLPYKTLVETLLRKEAQRPVLLVSGDVGFYSISSALKERLPDWDLEYVNGLSSLQVLCARAGVPYDRVKVASVHGRSLPPVPLVSYNEWTFFLTGGDKRANHVLKELTQAGLGHVRAWVGENLTMRDERLLEGTAFSLAEEPFASLAVVLLHNSAWTDPFVTLRDDDFARGKAPMTKEEIRAVSLARLSVRPGDVCYDIGAGTGSVSVAMAYLAREGMVYAIERKEEAFRLLEKNRRKLGAFNVVPVFGAAPEAIDSLPAPDCVFIGGSGGELGRIIASVLQKNPNARFVVNAITLETLQESVTCLEQAGISPEISCISGARAELVGRYHMMKAQNPVYVISGRAHG